MIRAYDLALAEPLETGRGLLTSFTGALHEHPDGGLGDHPGLEAVQGFGQELCFCFVIVWYCTMQTYRSL